MDPSEQQADLSAGIVSPQSSVDASSRDRAVVTEELEKKLKTRAERQDLIQRNILPDFARPFAPKLFNQTRELQRTKLVDNLQKKLRNRSDPHHLMSMNILPDQAHIDPSLHGKVKELTKSKLADQLNDKLANRPGPLVLVRERILEPDLGDMVNELHVNSQSSGLLSESSGEGITPESQLSMPPEISFNGAAAGHAAQQRGLLAHRHSLGGGIPSPGQLMETSPMKEMASPLNSGGSEVSGGFGRKLSDSSISPAPSPGDGFEEVRSPVKSPQDQSPRGLNSTYPPIPPRAMHTPGVMTSSIGKAPSPSQNRKKAQKQQKYRKLRYHEYVPPTKSNGKGGKTTPKPLPKSDSPYSVLLQQQQLFLQLQVLQQQYPNGVIMQKLPDLISSLSKDGKGQSLISKGRVPVTSPASDGNRGGGLITSVPQVLQVEQPNKHNLSTIRFDDLKVSDLKGACKELGMIVSGKKAELVERLLDHNKGLLPAIALPDNSAKDTKRQSFSTSHASSLDSQAPSTLSPGSPSSPVFQFPLDKQGGGSQSSKPPNLPLFGHHSESMPSIALPEVLPGANFQQEFDELIERQKRNYFTQKLSSKSLAPRPDINDLVAIRVPPAYSSAQTSSAANAQGHVSTKGKVSTLPHHMDAKQLLMAAGEKNSRSLPSSPQPRSPDSNDLLELMDDNTTSSLMASSSTTMTTPSSLANATYPVAKSVSLPNNQSEQQPPPQELSSILMESVSAFLPLDESLGSSSGGGHSGQIMAPPLTTTSTVGMPTSMAAAVAAYQQSGQSPLGQPGQAMTPQQRQQLSQQQQQQQHKPHVQGRPNRSSVPVHPVHAKVHPMNPPSYSSHQMIHRSMSVSGPIPGVASHSQIVQQQQQRMQSGPGFGSDISEMVGTPASSVNEMGKALTPDGVIMSDGSLSHTDLMDMPMDTGDPAFSDFMDNIMFRPDGSDYPVHGQPSSLPVAHGHTHQLPHPPSHTFASPTKYAAGGNRQELVHSDSYAMPFGNPSFGLQGKTPSDMCLNMEGHRNSTGAMLTGGGNVMLADQELNWLDLDNHQALGFSPTIGSGFASNLNRHSNPGSLQHDQFHMNFLDDPHVVTTSSSGGGVSMMRSSNPTLNGFGDVPTSTSFLESGGVSHQSGLFPELLSS